MMTSKPTMAWSILNRRERLAGAAIIVLAAAAAVAPIFGRGPNCGSDLIFHLTSWMEAQNSMLLGIPYPHWAPRSNFGAGEPRFLFYPPLTWMAGAILGVILPWQAVGSVLGFLILAGIGLANRALGLEIMENGPATLAGCAAIFLGYPLLTFYVRSDFAELAGGIWIPLMILFVLRDRNRSGSLARRALDGSAVGLAVTVAGVWLTNGPAALMASYLLVGLACVAAEIRRSLAPLVRAFVASIIGLGVAGDFLVPAAWQQRSVNLRAAIATPHYWFQNSWLFSRHTDPSLAQFMHDQKLLSASWVAAFMFAMVAVSILVASMRGTLPGAHAGPRSWRIPLVLIPLAALFLMLPASTPLWMSLPRIQFLQFPWRWLLVVEAPLAILFASAFWFVPLRRRIPALVACLVLFLTLSAAAARLWFTDCGTDQDVIVQAEETGVGAHWKPEYALPGGDYGEVRNGLPGACLVNDLADVLGQSRNRAEIEWIRWNRGCSAGFVAALYRPEHKQVTGIASHKGYLVLKVRNYPAWRATVNGKPVTTITECVYGLMAVPVPEGPVNVVVDWTTTADVVAGRWTTIVSLLLLTGLWYLERKLHPVHLS